MSEDCLQLNVWTPAKTGDEKLPVMVWIYGGGLRVGNTQEMEFDGERIARRGVILVTVNYRLNAFGFMCHPDLMAEDPEYPTNFGHLDQRAGIQWVKRNIAAFGGDPENITVFGQSAGGGSTFVQVVSPLNKGLFQKAICHSSGGLLPPDLLSNSMEDALKNGQEFLKDLGVSTIEEARKLDAKVILEQTFKKRYSFGTVVGDKLVPDKPTHIVLDNNRNNVTIMTGYTEDEFAIKPLANNEAELEAFAKAYFGDRAEEYLAICRKGAESFEDMKKNGTYNRFEVGTMMWADTNVRLNPSKMYLYRFNPGIPGDDAGSFHSSELWFVFETLAKCWRPFQGRHYDIARQMCNYWTNFAKNGDPNGPDNDGTPMPEWKPITDGYVYPMFFGEVPAMDESPRGELENLLVDFFGKKLEARQSVEYAPHIRADGSVL